jgi:hypothetical protein
MMNKPPMYNLLQKVKGGMLGGVAIGWDRATTWN